jgi:4-hydroxybenzoate polyprenyltransferase
VVAWLQLLRLANVLTAVADVMMGYVVTHGDLQPPLPFALLVVASCLLYLSGMVLNDVFDAEVDARERPERPIPARRIPWQTAAIVGWALLASGVLAGWIASNVANDWRPGSVATALAVCVVLYDYALKRTPLAPFLMGACRTLNVLLGMSLAFLSKPTTDDVLLISRPWFPNEWLIAIGVGIYVVGVTVFARTEARASSRGRLFVGMAVLLGGMGLLAAVPYLTSYQPSLAVGVNGWYLLWAVLAMLTARRCALAVFDSSPPRVQAAVRHCVQSIIVLDAAVTVGYAGPFWGLVVLALIFPTLALAQWLKAT